MHRQVTAVAPLHPFANGGSAEASISVRPRLGNVEKAQARYVNSQDAKDRARGVVSWRGGLLGPAGVVSWRAGWRRTTLNARRRFSSDPAHPAILRRSSVPADEPSSQS